MSHTGAPGKTRGLVAAILEKHQWFRVLWWIAIAIVLVGSLLPKRELTKVMAFLPEISNKVQHFGAYLASGLLLSRSPRVSGDHKTYFSGRRWAFTQ